MLRNRKDIKKQLLFFYLILCLRNLAYMKWSRIKTMLSCSSRLIMRLIYFFKMLLKYLLNRLKRIKQTKNPPKPNKLSPKTKPNPQQQQTKNQNRQPINCGNCLFSSLLIEEEWELLIKPMLCAKGEYQLTKMLNRMKHSIINLRENYVLKNNSRAR